MTKFAVLYRMAGKDHVCPYGIRSKDLLERNGYQVKDHILDTPEVANAFKEKYDVKTTPQAFIDDKRIGGYEDLLVYMGRESKGETLSYFPVISLFFIAFLMAIALLLRPRGLYFAVDLGEMFIGMSMCFLAVLKFRDMDAFANQFITYDLFAQRNLRYAYIYPFIEAGAGVLMLSKQLLWIAAPLAFTAGIIGFISVFKALYIDKRNIKCACVGGNSSVPLGFVSLTENMMMILIALWMILY